MLAVVVAAMWVTLTVGVILLVAAAVGHLPRRVTLGLLAVAEIATLVAVGADVAYVVTGHPGPRLATHISYLLSTPLLIPAGVALTYKKFDRWGLLIVAVATLIAAIMIVRQVQTLGILFGYLNVG
ncbi:hypothetical protein [Mobilicoccus pelagius]|uniref:Uncharacterized protein n=1 Tax=Mobilicoccus pelagius NBRC 104925 TaxID=1089455 RepID=H5UTD2_9MICO|nr:hypothetical protein [Mobilicoccus pelagius]GAB48990.1 hypothetical protein MOPEL_094_00070 [Mobilicoccus pelagius NBRC 104925]